MLTVRPFLVLAGLALPNDSEIYVVARGRDNSFDVVDYQRSRFNLIVNIVLLLLSFLSFDKPSVNVMLLRRSLWLVFLIRVPQKICVSLILSLFIAL